MSEFNNVTIAKAANVLFDGNITSRTIVFEDGSRKTLGIMLPAQDWVKYEGPATFEIPANSKFKLRVHSLTDYCCSFIKNKI